MELSEIKEQIEIQRAQRFANSIQISLGALIKQIESCGTKTEDGKQKYVHFDFGTAVPSGLASWRGSYNELAIGYQMTGYDVQQNASYNKMADDFLSDLKNAVGRTYEGWKGGDYEMKEDTPLWVANAGNSGNTGVIGVLDDGWQLIILTCYTEY